MWGPKRETARNHSYTHRHTVFPTVAQKQKNQHTYAARHKNEP